MPASRYLDIGPPISRYWTLRVPRTPFHYRFDFVQVGLALSASGDLDEVCALQLLDELADARLAHAHVGGEPLLTGEAAVVVPGVMQEHRIGDLRAEAQRAVFENEIWDLS